MSQRLRFLLNLNLFIIISRKLTENKQKRTRISDMKNHSSGSLVFHLFIVIIRPQNKILFKLRATELKIKSREIRKSINIPRIKSLNLSS